MRLLDDVYYFDKLEQKWKPSFLISVIKGQQSDDVIFNRYLVAGYGPHLSHNHVISEDEYITRVDNKTIESLTQLAQKTK